MARRAKVADDENWVRPAHSGFEGPAIGEVDPVGSVWKDADGNTWVSAVDGARIIKKA